MPYDQADLLYGHCLRIINGDSQLAEAARSVESSIAMPLATAKAALRSIRHMIHGELYRWTINTVITDAVLEFIYRDFKSPGLQLALSSLLAHIEYYEGKRKSVNLRAQREIHRKYSAFIVVSDASAVPQELVDSDELYPEGAVERILVNRYERSRDAREACIAAHGCFCAVCGFDFGAVYGDLGKGFVHAHHLVELSRIGHEYAVNPVEDMRPVCPNCHAMLHRRKPALSIEELKSIILKAKFLV